MLLILGNSLTRLLLHDLLQDVWLLTDHCSLVLEKSTLVERLDIGINHSRVLEVEQSSLMGLHRVVHELAVPDSLEHSLDIQLLEILLLSLLHDELASQEASHSLADGALPDTLLGESHLLNVRELLDSASGSTAAQNGARQLLDVVV